MLLVNELLKLLKKPVITNHGGDCENYDQNYEP